MNARKVTRTNVEFVREDRVLEQIVCGEQIPVPIVPADKNAERIPCRSGRIGQRIVVGVFRVQEVIEVQHRQIGRGIPLETERVADHAAIGSAGEIVVATEPGTIEELVATLIGRTVVSKEQTRAA